ncbi:MAG TPA: nuclear transport factor 2 family protein [Acetobacteraceae bacterium]|nr:nuclear transport factor 2 family protein [Acetobacteraceae bacterium]
MKASTFALVTALLASASPALADTNASLARAHFAAVASGDVATIISQYAAGPWLSWVGGPLDGTYFGTGQITGVWTKFSKAIGPLKASVSDLREHGNPKGTTVTAHVVFTGKATVKVYYMLLYRGDKLVDEIWQIDPKFGH